MGKDKRLGLNDFLCDAQLSCSELQTRKERKQSSKEMETIYGRIINEIEAGINKYCGSLMVMVVISCLKPYMLVT